MCENVKLNFNLVNQENSECIHLIKQYTAKCIFCALISFQGIVISVQIILICDGCICSDLAFYGIYGATGLVFGVLAVWLEKIFVIVATSFTGSLMFLLG